jgi:hypothetical protein
MKITLEKLVEPYYRQNNNGLDEWVEYSDVLKLLKLCRLNTIIECADIADADYIYHGDLELNGTVEVYVLKESILQLDKNSIEL